MPTVVHSELLRLGRIEDPYKGMNEWECQCSSSPSPPFTFHWRRKLTCDLDAVVGRKGVGEADWVFRTTFELSEEQVQKKEQGGLDLVFEGLDTFCEVFLVRPSPLSFYSEVCRAWERKERLKCTQNSQTTQERQAHPPVDKHVPRPPTASWRPRPVGNA